MPHEQAPQPIVDLAEARAVARRAHDWQTADRLRGEIEAAGWKVIDAATLYSLERATSPDVTDGGIIRYGSSAAVPSRLDAEPVGVASVVMVATDWPADLARAMRALVDESPDGTQLIIVANEPSAEQAAALEGLDALHPGAPGISTEVLWTSARLGHAAALNAGSRRAVAPVVILLDTSVEPGGELVSRLVAALEDPTVAVAGPSGIVSRDLRHFADAPAGVTDVDAIAGDAMGFRRADYISRGPLDEHFVFYRYLDIWWSLVLRDQDPGVEEGGPAPRRAVRVTTPPVIHHEHRGWAGLPEAEQDGLSKKNLYRVLKRFATRRDLLVGG